MYRLCCFVFSWTQQLTVGQIWAFISCYLPRFLIWEKKNCWLRLRERVRERINNHLTHLIRPFDRAKHLNKWRLNVKTQEWKIWLKSFQNDQRLNQGPWSSGQRVCLLIRCSDFISRWHVQFFLLNWCLKRRKIIKKRLELVQCYKKYHLNQASRNSLIGPFPASFYFCLFYTVYLIQLIVNKNCQRLDWNRGNLYLSTHSLCSLCFFKNGPIPASFCLFSFFSRYNFNRRCAWDSNPGPQDGRCRQNHGAMAAILFAFFARSLHFVPDKLKGFLYFLKNGPTPTSF